VLLLGSKYLLNFVAEIEIYALLLVIMFDSLRDKFQTVQEGITARFTRDYNLNYDIKDMEFEYVFGCISV
jgi:hypothetical protein